MRATVEPAANLGNNGGMKISMSALALLSLSFMVLGGPPRSALAEGPGRDDAAVRKAIEAEEAKFVRAEMHGDLDAMTKMFSGASLGKEAAASRIGRFRTSSASLVSERFEISSIDVCSDLAVESGELVTQLESPEGTPSTDRMRYLWAWRRQPDGTWKVARGLWIPEAGGAFARRNPPPVLAAERREAPAVAPSPAENVVPIPDPRSLSDGYIRNIQDDLKSTARRLRALVSDSKKLATASAKADKNLQAIIRDVGWIDVDRFGVASACDAAYIVSRSADAALMRATLPLMEKDLNHAGNDSACYKSALEAYRALAR